VATKLHNQMTGADLHPNAIDGTTGTELSPSSQATYDGRYVRTIGGTITPTANGTTTLRVTKADGTTQVFDIDTTNARVGIGTSTPGYPLEITAAATDILRLYSSSGNMQAIFESNGGNALLVFRKSGSDRWFIGNRATADTFFISDGAADRVIVARTTGFTSIGSTLTPTSLLHVGGAIATAITTTAKNAAYTAVATDSTILADATSGSFQITLPTAVGCAGRQYVIKRTGATNNVTVGGTSAQTFDGATTKTLGSQYATLIVQSDNANWQILSTLGTVS